MHTCIYLILCSNSRGTRMHVSAAVSGRNRNAVARHQHGKYRSDWRFAVPSFLASLQCTMRQLVPMLTPVLVHCRERYGVVIMSQFGSATGSCARRHRGAMAYRSTAPWHAHTRPRRTEQLAHALILLAHAPAPIIWAPCHVSYLEFKTKVGVCKKLTIAAPNMQRQPSERLPAGTPYFAAIAVTHASFTDAPVGSILSYTQRMNRGQCPSARTSS